MILNGERLNYLPIRSRKSQECSLLPFVFNTMLKVLVHYNKKKVIDAEIGKEVAEKNHHVQRKFHRFYKRYTRISEFNKAAGYKFNKKIQVNFYMLTNN